MWNFARSRCQLPPRWTLLPQIVSAAAAWWRSHARTSLVLTPTRAAFQRRICSLGQRYQWPMCAWLAWFLSPTLVPRNYVYAAFHGQCDGLNCCLSMSGGSPWGSAKKANYTFDKEAESLMVAAFSSLDKLSQLPPRRHWSPQPSWWFPPVPYYIWIMNGQTQNNDKQKISAHNITGTSWFNLKRWYVMCSNQQHVDI